MSTLVIISTTLITLALLFYSLGVWAERIARYLKPWHVLAFWIGFALFSKMRSAKENLKK
jgi:hypothetical protein